MPDSTRQTVRLRVDDRTAAAYQSADPALRRSAETKAADALRLALLSRRELAGEFRRFTAETGAAAEERGWTDEMNDALLRGDFDEG